MGVHWASCTDGGTPFTAAEHSDTKQRVFRGPGWEVAHEVGDEGWGGQVSGHCQ